MDKVNFVTCIVLGLLISTFVARITNNLEWAGFVITTTCLLITFVNNLCVAIKRRE